MQQLAEQQYAQQTEYQAPLAGFLKSIISGDPGATQTAAAPVVGQIASGYQAAKDQIYNQVPAGAARDVALAKLPTEQNSSISSAINSIFLQAFPTLANLGSSAGAQAVQEFGGALSGLSGASSTQNNVMQAQAASKASTMGFLGQLAGAAASPFAGMH